MTNRIGGPGPSEPPRGRGGPDEPTSSKFKEKMKKVEKIDEVDLDKQKKRALYTAPEETGELEDTLSDSETERAPSPYESDFMRSSGPPPRAARGFEDLSNEAIPSPPSSPPPQVNAPVPKIDPDAGGRALPQSQGFWKDVDMPDQPAPQRAFQENQPNFQRPRDNSQPDQQSSSNQQNNDNQAPTQPDDKKKKADTPPTSSTKHKAQEVPVNLQEKKKKEGLEGDLNSLTKSPDGKKSDTSKKDGPPTKPSEGDQLADPRKVSPDKTEANAAPSVKPFLADGEKEKKDQKSSSSKDKKDSATSQVSQSTHFEKPKSKEDDSSFAGTGHPLKQDEEHQGEGDAKKKVATVSSVTIPDPLTPIAQHAMQNVAPPAPSQVASQTAAIESLFRQMVGTIVFLAPTTPGISTTEITLNSANMQNSPFFNSKIQIEKYASAPDSLNVRLTGSPQAVKIFNDNIHTLTAAFASAYDNRRVQFRIGRLETSVATEKPLIRRKKEAGSQDDAGDRDGDNDR